VVRYLIITLLQIFHKMHLWKFFFKFGQYLSKIWTKVSWRLFYGIWCKRRLHGNTLRTFVTHKWRVLVIPINHIIIIQHHNMALTITTLQPHTNANWLPIHYTSRHVFNGCLLVREITQKVRTFPWKFLDRWPMWWVVRFLWQLRSWSESRNLFVFLQLYYCNSYRQLRIKQSSMEV